MNHLSDLESLILIQITLKERPLKRCSAMLYPFQRSLSAWYALAKFHLPVRKYVIQHTCPADDLKPIRSPDLKGSTHIVTILYEFFYH